MPTIGLVDGSKDSTTHRFGVTLSPEAVVQLDDLVMLRQHLPDGRELTHYGIVVEGTTAIEGAELSSDTRLIAEEGTMPGETVRRIEVQVLRTVPELWIPPLAGSRVESVSGEFRSLALFEDQMEQRLPVGLDQSGEPVHVDFSFFNGDKGGHMNISGISGVATKTSYALFFLYMLFETDYGRRMLGASAPATRAIVFNVKGEDLLHVDRPNSKLSQRTDAVDQWRKLGVENPGAFQRVRIYAPRSASSKPGAKATDVVSRDSRNVVAYAWSPKDFIRQGLLRFCFTDAEDSRNQLSFVELRVRLQLLRWAYDLEDEPGAVVLCQPPDGTTHDVSRLLEDRRQPKQAGEGHVVRRLADLVDFLSARLAPDDGVLDQAWAAGTQANTAAAFMRRLYAQIPRLGHLVSVGASAVELEESVTVVDIHSLHDDAQRFVVGALLSRIFEEKQGSGREPLRICVLDELNKYAPRQGTSPLKDLMIDIAARGRSLGVLLVGAQQSASNVDSAIFTNAAIKVVGLFLRSPPIRPRTLASAPRLGRP
jgi:DNA helicase HerA-like ATPase